MSILPSTNLVDHADNCYMSFSFFFLLFFYISSFWNLEISCYLFLLFFPSFVPFCSLSYSSFYSFLLFFLFPVLFSPSVYSLYFLTSLIVFFSNLCAILLSFPITLFCLRLPYVLLLFNLFSFCYSSSF